MGKWCYQIVRTKQYGYGLHEVYRSKKGKIDGFTQEPVAWATSPQELRETLALMLSDAITRPVLDESAVPDMGEEL